MEGMIPISGKTKLLAVIGSPVAHSQSPKIHNASFSRLGIDAVYLAFDVTLETLPTVAPALKDMGLAGYNVTMPLKQAIMEYMDELSDAARLIGAVNTVAIRDGVAFGDNTDGRGFWQNCREHSFEVQGKRVLVLGAGGAGSAVFVQAALEGASHVSVMNRRGANFQAAEERARLVFEACGVPVSVLDIEDETLFERECTLCDIVVNCTKVGMAPDTQGSLVPQSLMHPGMTVADIVYNPLCTKMIEDARAMGLNTVPGLGMLLWQGAIGEEVWFPGAKMDVEYVSSLLDLA